MRVVTSQENGVTMLYAAKTIHVGDHLYFSLFGLTFDTDIAMSTALALAIIIFMAIDCADRHGWRAGKISAHLEILLVDMVGDLVKSSLATRASDSFRWA